MLAESSKNDEISFEELESKSSPRLKDVVDIASLAIVIATKIKL
jgi:hypothetical protein